MKSIRLFFIVASFLPVCLEAQTGRWEESYLKLRPDTSGTIIHLPHIAYYQIAAVALAQHPYRFVIKDDSTYKKLFLFRPNDTWPQIDFSKHILIAFAACLQCISLNTPGDDQPRHRNACQYQVTWYLKQQKVESIPAGN